MKRILPAFCLFLLVAVKGFSQQFSQYNTGTLYDSFENPSQRSFVPDTSKMYASNFLVPNFGGNFYLKGDAQSTLVNRVFGGKYDNSALTIGAGKYNYANVNASAYSIMFKTFTSLNGDVEIGFFLDTKAEGRGAFTDETIALLNGPASFPANTYDNLFNDHYLYQVYNAVGFSYREKLSKQLAIGFKISALLGIDYNKLDIYESHINFDKVNDAADLSVRGRYYQSQGPGNLDSRSFLPNTRSPGAQISLGSSYRTDEGVTIQANVKDLGFIHWYNASVVNNFNATETIEGLSDPKREESIYNTLHNIELAGRQIRSFTSPTDARFELSVTKSYFLDDNQQFKYSPTLIGSKEILYNGFTGALVNRVQYKNYNASLIGSYDNMNLFNLGLQFMIKSHNGEFYIGSERLFQTVGLAMANSNPSAYGNGSFTGADFFLGFSLKFGPVIEHPMNASSIPNGEKGFFGRLYNRLFKTNW